MTSTWSRADSSSGDWRGHLGTPKSGRNRELPLSGDAVAALNAQRHLRGELVFCTDSGRAFKENECKWPMWRACRRTGLRKITWHESGSGGQRGGRPPKLGPVHFFVLRLPAELHEHVRRHAHDAHLSVNEVITGIVADWWKQRSRPRRVQR